MSRSSGGQTLSNASGQPVPMSRGTSASTSGDRAARAAAAEQRAAAAASRGAPKGPGKLGQKLAAEQSAGGTGGQQTQVPERQVVCTTLPLLSPRGGADKHHVWCIVGVMNYVLVCTLYVFFAFPCSGHCICCLTRYLVPAIMYRQVPVLFGPYLLNSREVLH